MLSTQSHAQNESNSDWYRMVRGRNSTIFHSRAQNACKKKCFVTKMRRRREKKNTRTKTIVSDVKTLHIFPKSGKNSSKIAPKARKFWGIFGIFRGGTFPPLDRRSAKRYPLASPLDPNPTESTGHDITTGVGSQN